MGLMKTLVVLSVVIAGLSYHLYTPVPDGVKEKGKLRTVLAVMKIVDDFAVFGDYIGYDTYINITRKMFNAATSNAMPQDDPNIKVTEQHFDGVRVLVYDPVDRPKNSRGMVYYHGGGWVYLNPEAYDPITRELARRLKMLVVSVDYRLAPEHKFPIPFQDCETATVYFLKNAAKFNVDPTRIAIGGDSAGGNLAAAISIKHRKSIKAQVLIYPAVQLVEMILPAVRQNAKYAVPMVTHKGIGICASSYVTGNPTDNADQFIRNQHTTEEQRQSVKSYLDVKNIPAELLNKEKYGEAKIGTPNESLVNEFSSVVFNQYASPLFAKDVTTLPMTYLLTLTHDAIRDEGVLYAKRLKKEGAKITWVNFDDGWHGYVNFINTPGRLLDFQSAWDFVEHLIQYLQKNL